MPTVTEMKQNISAFDQKLDQAKAFVTENRTRLRAIDKANTTPMQRLGGNLVALMDVPVSKDASYNAFRRKLLLQVHTDKFSQTTDKALQNQARDAYEKTNSFLKEFHIETLWNHYIDESVKTVKTPAISEQEAKTRSDALFNQLAQIVRKAPEFSADDVCDFLNELQVLEQPESVQSGLFCRLLDVLKSGGSNRIRSICGEAATLLLCIPQFMLTNSIQESYRPLLISLKLDLRDLTEALLQRDEILINLTDEDLNTALHLAVLREDAALVDRILENPHTDLTATNSFGDTALETARDMGNQTIIGKILSKT